METVFYKWTNVMGLLGGRDVRHYVETVLGEYAAEYDLDALTASFVDEINCNLIVFGVTLVGDKFVVYEGARDKFDTPRIAQTINELDLYTLADSHRWDVIVACAEAGAAARNHIQTHINALVPSRYTQSELARRIGVTRRTIRLWTDKN